jgi:isopenicillin-N N-acyltransferase like protein
MGLKILDVAGSPREMGRQHALVAGDALVAFAADRVHLAGEEAWTGRSLDRSGVLALAERCVDAHRSYSPDLSEELAAMAEVAGLSLAELVVVNGFTDFIDTVYAVGVSGSVSERTAAPPGAAPPGADDCTAFLVPRSRSADAHALFAQTWDMHRSAEEHLIVLRGAPRDAPAFVTFTTLGCVGMIGMNEHGVCVGINNLSGGDGRVGVTWPFVVREVLRQRDLDGALHSLARADLAGAHNYLLLDRHGRGANVEATSTARHVTYLERDGLVHTNHCVAPGPLARQRPRDPETQAASVRRLTRAADLLDRHDLTPADLEAATRDPVDICYRGGPPRHLATCGAVVARPATLDFWAVAGLPSEGVFERVPLPA